MTPLSQLKTMHAEILSLESVLKGKENTPKFSRENHPGTNVDSANAINAKRQQDINETKEHLAAKNKQLEQKYAVTITGNVPLSERTVNRAAADKFIASLQIPSIQYIDATDLYEQGTPELITRLMNLKKGDDDSYDLFTAAIAKIKHITEATVEVFEENGKEYLRINGGHYQNASTGTKTTLAFCGMTRQEERNCIVLWDEPENGLHPTRRSRLLELMFEDQRQYILATHASEFAPVLHDQGKVFRCVADYNRSAKKVQLHTIHVADRRAAFLALEALGVHPAKTLFTANVVIWVEGPTELLFYRHWLVPRLNELQLREGFHFTFMLYGGGLLSYLGVADDTQFTSTFDLISICRQPVIIVDSDVKEDPEGKDPILKKGVIRIKNEIIALNEQRPDAALFEASAGREIENYLPETAVWHAISKVWVSYAKHETALRARALKIGRYDFYADVLEKHFIDANVINTVTATGDDSDDESEESHKVSSIPARPKAKGRTRWGESNKVEMMRQALTMENFKEEHLQWDCKAHLDRIVNFVRAAAKT